MSNPQYNPLTNAVRQMMFQANLSEAVDIIKAPAGSKSLNYIDLADVNEPKVVPSGGAGTMPYSHRRKDIARRLRQFADQHEQGTLTSTALLKWLTNTDGKTGGDLTMWWLQAYADAEQVLESPSGKAKIAKAKMAKEHNIGMKQSMARNKARDEAEKTGKAFDSSAWNIANPTQNFR